MDILIETLETIPCDEEYELFLQMAGCMSW